MLIGYKRPDNTYKMSRAALSLACENGKATFTLMWTSSLGDEFVPVVAEWSPGNIPARPIVWDVMEYSIGKESARAPTGETERLVASIPEGVNFYMTAHNLGERKRAVFTSVGMRNAYDRVQASCKANPDGFRD